jgi:hypothetical protein
MVAGKSKPRELASPVDDDATVGLGQPGSNPFRKPLDHVLQNRNQFPNCKTIAATARGNTSLRLAPLSP